MNLYTQAIEEVEVDSGGAPLFRPDTGPRRSAGPSRRSGTLTSWRASRNPPTTSVRATARDPALAGCRTPNRRPGHGRQDRGHGSVGRWAFSESVTARCCRSASPAPSVARAGLVSAPNEVASDHLLGNGPERDRRPKCREEGHRELKLLRRRRLPPLHQN
jgi:hypothetical protein